MAIRSRGQKRARLLKIVLAALFVVSTAAGVSLLGFVQSKNLAWVQGHEAVTATITHMDSIEETYRNRKGKRRTRMVNELEYAFTVDGVEYGNALTVDDATYEWLWGREEVLVWHGAGDPSRNLPGTVAAARVLGNSSAALRAVSVVPYTFGGAFFLFHFLSFLFVRESGRTPAEGFHTERSWLDIEDHQLVALGERNLLVLEFDRKRTRKVQAAYQDGTSLKEIVEIGKGSFRRIPLAAIDALESRHDKDTVIVRHGEEEIDVEFITAATKEHALTRIAARLPAELVHRTVKKSRLASAAPALAVLVAAIGVGAWANVAGLWAIVGLFAVAKLLPTVVRRLVSPTVVQLWERESVEETVIETGAAQPA